MPELSFEPKKRKKGLLIVLTLLIILLCLALLYFSYLLITNTYNRKTAVSDVKSQEIEFYPEAGTVYNHGVTDNKIYFYSIDTVCVLSTAGKEEARFSIKTSNPVMSSDGNFALIADRGGKNAYIFSGNRQQKELSFDESILLSKMSAGGYSLFVLTDPVYKHSVVVVSDSGEIVFKWNSGSHSVVSADIADNNRDIAVTTISTDDGNLSSTVYMFNITKDKPFTKDAYSDEIFSDLIFSGKYLYAIGSDSTLIYNGYGKCIGNVDYEGRELLTYDIDGSLLAFAYGDSSSYANGTLLRSYGAKGQILGNASLDAVVKFVDCKNDNIAINNSRVISVFDSKCREKFRLNTETSLLDFLFSGGTNTAIGISASGAELINVK